MNADISTRSGDAIAMLIEEHDSIKALLARLADAQGNERSETLDQLKAILTIHNAVEENLVYPALQEIAGKKSESQKLYHETAEAAVLIYQIDSMLKEGDVADYERKAEKLQGAILEHIEDEEDSAFRHLRENATPEQTQMLTDAAQRFRTTFRFIGENTDRSTTGTIG